MSSCVGLVGLWLDEEHADGLDLLDWRGEEALGELFGLDRLQSLGRAHDGAHSCPANVVQNQDSFVS